MVSESRLNLRTCIAAAITPLASLLPVGTGRIEPSESR
jgi:hypothetical protein